MTILTSPTLWLILANLGVYMFLGLQGVSPMAPSPDELVAWGGNLGPYTLTGEWPRLLASMFLHDGAPHLLLNLFLLAQIGALSEVTWGKARFALIYLFSGLFGAWASAWWHARAALRDLERNPLLLAFGAEPALATTVSVGASAAVLGATAALVVHTLRDGRTSRAGLTVIFQVATLYVGLGCIDAGVDNVAHLGGVLAGLAIGAMLALPGDRVRVDRHVQSGLALVACLMVLVQLVDRPASADLVKLADSLRDTAAEAAWAGARDTRRAAIQDIARVERASLPRAVAYHKATGATAVFKGLFVAQGFRPGSQDWYAVDGATNRLARMTLGKPKIDRSWPGPPLPEGGSGVAGAAVARDGRWALVTAMTPDTLSRIDLASGAGVWSLRVGRDPRAVFLSDNEQFAFVVHGLDNVLSVIDLKQQKLLSTQPIGLAQGDPLARAPIGAVQGQGRLFFTDPAHNAIHAIDTEAPGRLRRVMSTGRLSPELVALSADGMLLVVAGPGGMLAIDPHTFTINDRFFTCFGRDVAALAVSPDGARIAVNAGNGQGIRVVGSASQRVLRVFPAPDGDNALRFADDGEALYLFTTSRTGDVRSALTRFDLANTLSVEADVAFFGELFCPPRKTTRSAALATPAS